MTGGRLINPEICQALTSQKVGGGGGCRAFQGEAAGFTPPLGLLPQEQHAWHAGGTRGTLDWAGSRPPRPPTPHRGGGFKAPGDGAGALPTYVQMSLLHGDLILKKLRRLSDMQRKLGNGSPEVSEDPLEVGVGFTGNPAELGPRTSPGLLLSKVKWLGLPRSVWDSG